MEGGLESKFYKVKCSRQDQVNINRRNICEGGTIRKGLFRKNFPCRSEIENEIYKFSLLDCKTKLQCLIEDEVMQFKFMFEPRIINDRVMPRIQVTVTGKMEICDS